MAGCQNEASQICPLWWGGIVSGQPLSFYNVFLVLPHFKHDLHNIFVDRLENLEVHVHTVWHSGADATNRSFEDMGVAAS